MNRYKIRNKYTGDIFVMNAMSLHHIKEKLQKLTIGRVDYEITLYTIRQAKHKPKIHNITIEGVKI